MTRLAKKMSLNSFEPPSCRKISDLVSINEVLKKLFWLLSSRQLFVHSNSFIVDSVHPKRTFWRLLSTCSSRQVWHYHHFGRSRRIGGFRQCSQFQLMLKHAFGLSIWPETRAYVRRQEDRLYVRSKPSRSWWVVLASSTSAVPPRQFTDITHAYRKAPFWVSCYSRC